MRAGGGAVGCKGVGGQKGGRQRRQDVDCLRMIVPLLSGWSAAASDRRRGMSVTGRRRAPTAARRG